MEATLGEKIKALRKQLALTQSQLAGTEMTKSMLSQIENNLATPSMKSLQYIAGRLNKPVSYFLDALTEQHTKEEALPAEEMGKQVQHINKLYDDQSYESALTEVDRILSSYIFEKKGKTYADLLFLKGKCLINLNQRNSGVELVKEAIDINIHLNMYADAAKAYLVLFVEPWSRYAYNECLEILDQAWSIYQKSITRDIYFEIEYLYNQAVVHSSIDFGEKTLRFLDQAIEQSHKSGVLYEADELYRIYAGLCLFTGLYDEFKEKAEKALKLAQVIGRKHTISAYHIYYAIYENTMNNPKKALEHLEEFSKLMTTGKYWYHTVSAKSYYLLGDYQKCLEQATSINYPVEAYHKFDYLMLWHAKIMEGLAQSKLGRLDKAEEAILYGIEKMQFFEDTSILADAYKSLSEVYSAKSDYEKAFKALKRADDIKESLSNKKLSSKQ